MYLARSGKGAVRRVRAKQVHAPARRLARTIISLGQEEGINFGVRAIRWGLQMCACLGRPARVLWGT